MSKLGLFRVSESTQKFNGGVIMKLSKLAGRFFMRLSGLFVLSSAASAFGVGVEDMPKSMKDAR